MRPKRLPERLEEYKERCHEKAEEESEGNEFAKLCCISMSYKIYKKYLLDQNSVESPETKSDEKQSYIHDLETTLEASKEYIKLLEDKLSHIKSMRYVGGYTKEDIESRTRIRVSRPNEE